MATGFQGLIPTGPNLPDLIPFKPQMPDFVGAADQREARRQQKIANSQKKLDFVGKTLSGVKDQKTLDLSIKVLENFLVDPKDIEQMQLLNTALFPDGFNQEGLNVLNQLFPSKPQRPTIVSPGAALVDPTTGDVIREQPFRPSTSKLRTYSKKNIDGSVRTIKNVVPGSEQEKQLSNNDFIQGTQTVGAKITAQERKAQRLEGAVDKLQEQAAADPNKFHQDNNFRMNDDGSIFIDPVTDSPTRLPSFFKATGKRGNIKAIIALGEQMDDAKELAELLELTSVQANLKKAESDGLWSNVAGRWSNAITKWMQGQGIGGDSPTATAVARIQRMTSEERKKFMGTAVTDNEIKSALAWMPSGGDSFDSIVNKTRLMGTEAKQEFIRWLKVFEKDADMSSWYKAFGLNRFGPDAATPFLNAPTEETPVNRLTGDISPSLAVFKAKNGLQ